MASAGFGLRHSRGVASWRRAATARHRSDRVYRRPAFYEPRAAGDARGCRLLGGTPPGIGLRLRSALRHDRGRQGRNGSVSDPSDRHDTAIFTSRWRGYAGPLPACNPPTRAVAVTQCIALLFALAPQLPSCAPGSCALALGLLAFSCAADIVILPSIPPNWVGRRSVW
jgi:hypothetical protein